MNINFKQPKYILPLVLLAPILFIGYQIGGMIDFEADKPEEQQVTVGEINVDMPKPNMEGKDLKTKYQNMLEGFGKEGDYAAVQNIEQEEENNPLLKSVYTDEEIQKMDSLNAQSKRMQEELNQMRAVQNGSNQYMPNYSNNNQPENHNANSSPSNANQAYIDELLLLQKIAKGEEILTPEQQQEREEAKRLKKEKEEERKRIEEENKPKVAVKADDISSSHFNTIQNQENNTRLIKAMIDQETKVVDGSRIKIKLMDNIVIENVTIPKGTYLYAIVDGFSAQRVRATVSSIIINDEHVKLALNIYDTDGMQGIYVPNSSFRDMTKEAGAAAMQSNININSTSSGEQNMEDVAMQALQNVYQATSNALSRKITENKATIKYNTTVYLINDN